MSNLIKPGRIFFALGIISLGILQFFTDDYIIGRVPTPAWAADIPGKLAWAYISGSLLVIAGLAIIFSIKGGIASLFIGILILVISFFLRSLPHLITNNKFEGVLYELNAYKSLALAGGAFIVAATFFMKEGRNAKGIIKNSNLIGAGCFLLALFLFICGLAHFKFHEFVKDFIPGYIPQRPFWTHFTAIALLAAGVGLMIKPVRRWAAFFAGLMILLWFFLLHIPRTSYSPKDYTEWMGVFESFAFSGVLFVLAGIFSKKKSIATAS